MSSLTVKRKCPHEGTCDIDAERTDKASGSQQFDGGPYDHGAGSDFDGSERAPHQAYSGGLQKGRRSYAGAVVDVLEGQDGHLAVRYQGEIIPSQEAPPRPGLLRSFNGSSSHRPPAHGGLNGLGRRWAAALAALDAEVDAGDADDNGAVRVRKAPAMQHRKPTPLQTARWNAVQKAKRRGLSIRGVARELGIHRDTAKKYLEAASPPMKRSTGQDGVI